MTAAAIQTTEELMEGLSLDHGPGALGKRDEVLKKNTASSLSTLWLAYARPITPLLVSSYFCAWWSFLAP
ncbi:hypothetical protein MITS9509_01529 [Synechococcus sp. MIT S9509]|uniref:hypothetical protein n=1 Tax=Synechococcus sp. MIT S9504 TaxID=1801628 RepID=UPI0007BBE709|nr:hypothetical protein [Synechococcus sp. MIT S9504]KZR86523.1 hypothetical protein MITS9504_01123 [Synechococcus sp. MIT S9504]KZR92537.1 hypothetical protein MITS9509_01529 [Synechococcus sp. MIT S9509]